MARWLFCQSCQQWSKSTTATSGDGSCPLCGNPFIKTESPQETFPIPSAAPSEDVENETKIPTQEIIISQPDATLESVAESKKLTIHNAPSVAPVDKSGPEKPIADKTVEQPEPMEEIETENMDASPDAPAPQESIEDGLEDEEQEEVPDILETVESVESSPAQETDGSKVSRQHESYMELRRRKRRPR